MMIKRLDEQVINKIAAGEVVERPASVIKELVENSIDAKATKIVIEVKDGGKKLIRISDDGTGIKSEELKMAILPHTTSKITKADDLFDIHTLGFRGEALASINAVSNMEITTKTAEENIGSYFVSDGFNDGKMTRVGAPKGTTIVVKNLFYNTPVRKKFLKSSGVELSYITELIGRLASSNPQISFKFISNNNVKLFTNGDNKLHNVIYEIYGKKIGDSLMPVSYEDDHIDIKGFVGKPEINRGNKVYENYFVNGRYVKCKIIEKAVENGFKEKLMKNRFPFCVLHISVDRKKVDVNVHPNKLEIRFDDENFIYQNVYRAIENALDYKEYIITIKDKEDLEQEILEEKLLQDKLLQEKAEENKADEQTIIVQKMNENQNTNTEKNNLYDFNLQDESTNNIEKKATNKVSEEVEEIELEKEAQKYLEEVSKEDLEEDLEEVSEKVLKKVLTDENIIIEQEEIIDVLADDEIKVEQVQPMKVEPKVDFKVSHKNVQENFLEKKSIKKHKIIGQLFDTYWIIEMENKMYMIDQHAAHEKVLYEKFVNTYKSGNLNSQTLLFPLVLDLNEKMIDYLENHMEQFSKLGFDLEKFGDNEYILRAVPYLLNDSLDEDSFIALLDEMMDYSKDSAFNVYLDSLATAACKAAIKGNDKLSVKECEALIDELLELENPYHCPHGRPTMIVFEKKKIEKDFKRIV